MIPDNLTLPEKPFKLATTSFIIPDNIIPNVRKLGPFFDEIELLVFESQPENVLPGRSEVEQLLSLSQRFNLSYNVHLPVDVSISSTSAKERAVAGNSILKVIDLFAPLKPTSYTLHLDIPKSIQTHAGEIIKWQKITEKSLESLRSQVPLPEIISIETLDYPFDFVEPFIEKFNFSVCIDAGHQIKYGYNLLQTFEKQRQKTAVIHLHGVEFSQNGIKDHTSLDKLPERHMNQVKTILNSYSGVISIEVFNLNNLNRSLKVLSKLFRDIQPEILLY